MARGCALAVAVVLGLVGYGARPASAQLNCDAGIDFYPGGAIRSCTLNGHHRIHTAQGQPLTCASGHVLVLYEDGRLQRCVLGQPLTSGSLRCEAGSRVEFRPDGTLARCEPVPGPGGAARP